MSPEDWARLWRLPPSERWRRPRGVWADTTSECLPADELARKAAEEADPGALNELRENPHALAAVASRWAALAELVACADDPADQRAAASRLDVLTSAISVTLDSQATLQIDPAPLWKFRDAGWEAVHRTALEIERPGGRFVHAAADLTGPLRDALPLVRRVESLATCLPRPGVRVSSAAVARLVHKSPRTTESWRKEWGPPAAPSRGSAPALWDWQSIAPIVRRQCPGAHVPDAWPAVLPTGDVA